MKIKKLIRLLENYDVHGCKEINIFVNSEYLDITGSFYNYDDDSVALTINKEPEGFLYIKSF